MKIRLVWVGKTKERFVREGIDKYLRLLGYYAEVELTEVKEEKGTDVATIVRREGERIMKLQTPYTLLDEKGRHLSSVEFSGFVADQGPAATFILGGAYGVSGTVREQARQAIALSKMTLTHEMARLVLLEQLYRAFTIQHRKGYHH